MEKIANTAEWIGRDEESEYQIIPKETGCSCLSREKYLVGRW